MSQSSTHVGLDVHKKQIVVALVRPEASEAVEWRIANEPRSVRRLARRMKREGVGELTSV